MHSFRELEIILNLLLIPLGNMRVSNIFMNLCTCAAKISIEQNFYLFVFFTFLCQQFNSLKTCLMNLDPSTNIFKGTIMKGMLTLSLLVSLFKSQ